MNKLFVTIAFLATFAAGFAQDVEQAKKAIDAEQYEKAKTMLKTVIATKPSDGRAAFLLGNIYLKQNIADSAKIYFQKGLSASEGSKLNYIGLGQIDLNNGNTGAAQANFAQATKDIKKKATEELVYVARAYMDSDKPDYKNALAILGKAKTANPQDAQVQLALGDAYYGDKNQNEAYVAYRNAFTADASLIRAKMQLGVLLKGARAWTEAVKSFDNVIATNPNYGPVYRELAETYYLWGNNEPKKYNEYIQKALGYYEKYMSLTDYSLASRMRHADFLILAKDYKALEAEANKMKQLDKVNPRILRYLGYSAYENGNYDVAQKSLEDFVANPANKVIARDHLYLGLTKIKKSGAVEGKLDTALFDSGTNDIRKAVEMDINITNDLNEIGKKAYDLKQFKQAASIFEIAVTNPNSKNYLLDNFYLGNSIYYDNTRKEVTKPDPVALQKADTAFANVITASPTTQDAYIFRARTNRLLEKDEEMAKNYEEYLKIVTTKGTEEVTKNKAKVIEAYNLIGAHYANSDKTKAIEYFDRTLALDPANEYATTSIKELRKK
ncbi:MAG TPA: tetratricopeptide repeat protein [Flavobacterium sp.]|jgi:tetratricopeptide (TPR) repeat protein